MTSPPDDEASAINPLSDLLFSLAAVFILAVLLLLPMVRASGRVQQSPGTEDTQFNLNGQPLTAFLAVREGLILPGRAGQMIGQGAIADNPGLQASLNDLSKNNGRMLLLIEPGGEETAFQLEVEIAAHGPASLAQIRLVASCPSRGNPASCLAAGSRGVER